MTMMIIIMIVVITKITMRIWVWMEIYQPFPGIIVMMIITLR